MSALAQPPPSLSVRIHHKFRKIRSVLHQKVRTFASEEPLRLVRNMSALDSRLDCGHPLWTALINIGLNCSWLLVVKVYSCRIRKQA